MSIGLDSISADTPDRLQRPRRPIAYVISQYPLLSMIFVLREVLELRKIGVDIRVASINSPDRDRAKLTADEAAEADSTFYVKRRGVVGALWAHVLTVGGNFPGYFRGIGLVFQLGRLDVGRLAFNFFYFTEALIIRRWMKRNGLRHVHAHLGSQAATVGLYVHQVEREIGYSITVHGPDEFYDVQGQYLKAKIAAADFICCISNYTRSQLMRVAPYRQWSKLFVTHLGVDTAVFAPRAELGDSGIFEILCIGRLTPAKGQHVLIDAVEVLISRGRRVQLRIVGAGPDDESLRQSASRLKDPAAVKFEGAVNQDSIRALYASADIFCLPSFAEGIPIVLMEAMAMEVPCVTTHITGIPELIRNGVDGLLVAPSDLDGLANAIETLMDDRALRQLIGRNGRMRILEKFELHRNVRQLASEFARRLKE
jgi:colanic acid/amylovoran biosynthesis glycosyltransferase